MTFDYARSKATADRLIARFGQAAMVTRATASGPAYNPTPATPGNHGCVFAEIEREIVEVEGSRVKQTKIKGLLAVGSLPIEPATSDKLVLTEGAFSLTEVNPLQPGGTKVLYEVEALK